MGCDGKMRCFTLHALTHQAAPHLLHNPYRIYAVTVVSGFSTGKHLPATSQRTDDTADWLKRLLRQPMTAMPQSTITMLNVMMCVSTIKRKKKKKKTEPKRMSSKIW